MPNQKRASQKKFHYVYKTTRFDGKFYIGVHSTDQLDDGYLGSGQRLWHSINRHGKDKHAKEILEMFPTRQAAFDREAELVNHAMLLHEDCMNLIRGGGLSYEVDMEHRRKISDALKGKPKPPGFAEHLREVNLGKKASDEVRAKMSPSAVQARALHPKTDEERKKISEGNKGKPKSTCHRQALSASLIGIPRPESVKAKLRKQCTVDGIMIYPSRLELIKALGHGKRGMSHPNFRYI